MGKEMIRYMMPRRFTNEDELLEEFDRYRVYCAENQRLMNVSGFCAFVRFTRQKFYEYKNRPEFSDVMDYIESVLEDGALNHRSDKIGIFYLKNKFGYAEQVVQKTFTKTIEEVLDEVDGIDM